MKFLVKFVVLIFVLFQFLSAIYYLIDNNTFNSPSIELIDEDLSSTDEAIKVSQFIFYSYKSKSLINTKTNCKVPSKYLLKQYLVPMSIFVPPPKLV